MMLQHTPPQRFLLVLESHRANDIRVVGYGEAQPVVCPTSGWLTLFPGIEISSRVIADWLRSEDHDNAVRIAYELIDSDTSLINGAASVPSGH
jgi:hypothetical protein